ncbi:ATP-binding cassette domain-containing protein [Candidatus Gracilibacteria bacterium 28_42_T64]|nr:ATP-binding cassette domain-containing protein [Candidatus Gracilibacteria bacterium 28_42_T64]
MKIDKVSLAFRNKVILRDIDLEIKAGEFVFFIGYSGSGKTSLIRSLIGDFKPMKGDIILDNNIALYKNMSEETLLEYRRQIGVIFQDYKLLESKKVYENVAFAMEVCGYSDEIIRKKVPEALEQVGLLIKKDKFVFELSGGEKQRIAIARALVHDPKIILGDEPTGNLDPETAMEVMNIFLDLHADGKTIILATHDSHIVNSLKKRVIAFDKKGVVSDIQGGEYSL